VTHGCVLKPGRVGPESIRSDPRIATGSVAKERVSMAVFSFPVVLSAKAKPCRDQKALGDDPDNPFSVS
jgi:hypothetical protein